MQIRNYYPEQLHTIYPTKKDQPFEAIRVGLKIQNNHERRKRHLFYLETPLCFKKRVSCFQPTLNQKNSKHIYEVHIQLRRKWR